MSSKVNDSKPPVVECISCDGKGHSHGEMCVSCQGWKLRCSECGYGWDLCDCEEDTGDE